MATRAKLSFSIDSLINKDAAAAVAAAAAAAVAVAAANHQDGGHHHSSGILKPSSKYASNHGGQHQSPSNGHHNGLMIRVDDTEAERLHRHRQMMMAPFTGQWPSPGELTPPEQHPQRISSASRKRTHDSENHTSSKRHSQPKKVTHDPEDDEEINVDDVDVDSISSSHDDECGSCRSGSFERTGSPNSNSFYDSMTSPGKLAF